MAVTGQLQTNGFLFHCVAATSTNEQVNAVKENVAPSAGGKTSKTTELAINLGKNVVDPTKVENQQQSKKEEDVECRTRRNGTKKVKYVEEDDVSEEEAAILADKKKRAQQLDYQQRTVRCLGVGAATFSIKHGEKELMAYG